MIHTRAHGIYYIVAIETLDWRTPQAGVPIAFVRETNGIGAVDRFSGAQLGPSRIPCVPLTFPSMISISVTSTESDCGAGTISSGGGGRGTPAFSSSSGAEYSWDRASDGVPPAPAPPLAGYCIVIHREVKSLESRRDLMLYSDREIAYTAL
ncbi:hypothetical protein EVAR_100813_1 [Eumeta japonica]|uniref:Uncharacterized protein n=1 Tax=Eumeta variegata TaxID=151549 RepID=A0A4C2A4U8_EUMVA|nr:hypothetical protein EVAR_100813_1 [Eumeta japonica]